MVVQCNGDKIRHHDKKEMRIAFMDNDFTGKRYEANRALTLSICYWALEIADIKIHLEHKQR